MTEEIEYFFVAFDSLLKSVYDPKEALIITAEYYGYVFYDIKPKFKQNDNKAFNLTKTTGLIGGFIKKLLNIF